jgi:tryptophan 2,3-dioxygenase
MAKDYASHVDVSGEDKIHWDFSKDMSYGQYLQLEPVLDAQKPLTDAHDEMMFIIIHQTGELWMKLCVHELTGAIHHLQKGDIGPALKMLTRISRIQEQLIQSWRILGTMTPSDYLAFRDALGHSSGFQSYLYRTMEFSLGNKNPAMARVHKDHPVADAMVQAALEAPSLYDEVLKLLARAGFSVPESATSRDWRAPYEPDVQVEAVWREIYSDPERHWRHYELGEKLVDLEDKFQQWRFSHMKTVERIIGYRQGTGGTSGVAYLKKALDLRFFPELWTVRTAL